MPSVSQRWRARQAAVYGCRSLRLEPGFLDAPFPRGALRLDELALLDGPVGVDLHATSAKRSRTSSRASALPRVSLSFRTISGGVPAGAAIPTQPLDY